MKPIQIQEAKQKARTVDFLGWTDRDQRRAFLAWSENGQPLRATLEPACPLNGHFKSNPIPDRELVEIVPYRLLPPPCRANKAQANLDDPDNYFEPWERVYGSCWYLDDADEKPLRERWEDFKKRAREAYEENKKAVGKLTADDYRFERYGAESRRKVTQAELEKWRKVKLATVESIFNAPHEKHGRCDTAGYLNTTFDMAKNGAGKIRNDYLHGLWATERNIDPLEFAQERELFKQSIKNNVQNVIKRIYNIKHREKTFEPDLDMRWPDWQCLFASVRYRARFDDGSSVYLSDFAVSDQLTPAELADIKQYRVADVSALPLSEGVHFDPKSAALIDGNERLCIYGDVLKIVEATVEEIRTTGKQEVDLGIIAGRLAKDGKLDKKWPNAGERIDQLFNYGKFYPWFTRLYRAMRKQTVLKGKKSHKYTVLFREV